MKLSEFSVISILNLVACNTLGESSESLQSKKDLKTLSEKLGN